MQYYYFSFIWEFFSSRLDHICQLVSLPSRRIPSVLSNIESAQFDTINRTIKGLMLPSAVTYVHSKGDSSQNGKTFSYPIHITRSGPDRRSVSFLIQCGTFVYTDKFQFATYFITKPQCDVYAIFFQSFLYFLEFSTQHTCWLDLVICVCRTQA